MELIGTIITYIIMACCVVGATSLTASLSQSFNDGLHAMANLFIPICGLMASVPFLTVFIPKYIGPIFNLVGAGPGRRLHHGAGLRLLRPGHGDRPDPGPSSCWAPSP